MDLKDLDIKASLNRETYIKEEVERLKGKTEKTAEDRAKVPTLMAEFREVHEHRLNLEHDAALNEIRSATEGVSVTNETTEGRSQVTDQPKRSTTFIDGKYRDPWNTAEVRYGRNSVGELRDRAKAAVERMPFAEDNVREAATKFVERSGERSAISELVLATTSPKYMDAFAKVIRSEGNLAFLDREEQQALSRAMSLTDNAGGYLVPFQLDPTVILTASGSVNQVRQISRVVTATGDTWNGVSSAGVTASWDSEAAQVSDDSPTLASPSIPIYKGQAYVQVSHEVAADAPTLADEVARMIAFEKDRLESVAFITGSGSGEPTGIITALTGGSYVKASAGSDTFAIGDVYALDAELPARFAANGSWLAHRAIYNKTRQFDTAGGNALWGQLSEGRKPDLLGRPNYVSEAMDGTITALSDNLVLLFGDFQNFVIADRLGATMRFIPDTFGANGRPTGQSGWLCYWRVGSDSVNDAAFRLLNVT